MRVIDADRFYINYARRFSREPLKVEFFKQFLDAEPTVDVLDKIRAEIDRQEKWLLQAGYTAYNVDIAFDAIKSVVAESEE